MGRLFVESDFEQKLSSCRKEPVKTSRDQYHETFCCKKEIVKYFDSNDDELAILTIYTRKDMSIQRVISRLRIGNDVYDLKLL